MGMNSNTIAKVGACAAIGVPMAMYLKDKKSLGIFDYLLISSAIVAVTEIATK